MENKEIEKCCEDHKEKTKEYMKKYREMHKEKAKEYMKKYREDNKEYKINYNKEYYKNNKKKIFDAYSEKIECDICGVLYQKRARSSHFKSNRHKLMGQINTFFKGGQIELIKKDDDIDNTL